MSEVPLRRIVVPCVLAVLVIAGCAATKQDDLSGTGLTKAPTGNCGTTGLGTQMRDAPIVCVDGGTTLSVNPESIVAFNVMSTDHATPPVIQWVTRSGGGNLKIDMKDPGCVETPINCNAPGKCTARVVRGLGPSAKEAQIIKTCRYTVTLDTRVLDPETVIVGCCSDAPPEP